MFVLKISGIQIGFKLSICVVYQRRYFSGVSKEEIIQCNKDVRIEQVEVFCANLSLHWLFK